MEPSEICLQSLQHYNEGMLIFKWYDIEEFDNSADMIEDFKKYVKEKTGDKIEELMVADYSSFCNMGEYPDWDEIDKIIELINDDTIPKDAIIAYYDNFGGLDNIEEAYQGEWDSEMDFTYDLIDNCYDLDKQMGSLSSYFDYESFNRDLFMTDYVYLDGYVFMNL